eukprot:TRINITY_DN9274_c0_g1_i1.p1 TRINITY_DN9274_c0_g1~~TRINITY_DN9274_c0_g1_i1.p1  ORF type:complete len:293 (-),score=49.85 TRINITY_DN9274_c0_g1_i1:47-925(-)
MSFDIAPYRFDLTPFAGILNDGKSHNITISVFGDNQKGFWYLDATFVLYNDQKGATIDGHLLKHVDEKPHVNVEVSSSGDSLSLYTTAKRSYSFEGKILTTIGNVTTTTVVSVHGDLNYENFNTISSDGSVQETSGFLETSITSEVQQHKKQESRFYYPFNVFQSGTEKNGLLEIRANVLYSRERQEKFLPAADGRFFEITWKNTISSTAFYNRSADNSESPCTNDSECGDVIYAESNDSVETFVITSPTGLCYNAEAHAVNGPTLSDSATYNCTFDKGMEFCGFELCPYTN